MRCVGATVGRVMLLCQVILQFEDGRLCSLEGVGCLTICVCIGLQVAAWDEMSELSYTLLFASRILLNCVSRNQVVCAA